jgi:hypothetical protein
MPACSSAVNGAPKYGKSDRMRVLSGMTPSASDTLLANVMMISITSSPSARPLKPAKSNAASEPSS